METMFVLEKSLEDMKEINGEEFRVVRSNDDEMIVRCDDRGTMFVSRTQRPHFTHTNKHRK